ncbi:hypothetical protein [Sphingobacterium paucimobilis]|uniref:hypothetical protein n=1 Tax=Sphingobacterium paucimobilis TaxID=1385985 RepID=UPI00130E4AFC|nr:hypothetical protein [Sphingobacterium paucimobilis]
MTIIAICLLVIAFKDVKFFPDAHAANSSSNLPLKNNTNYGLVPINEDGSINVRLHSNDVVDVRLRGIDEASNLRWEAIKVEVQN